MTTLTLFGCSGKAKIWAFAQMTFARPKLHRVPSLRFWKLLGSGHGRGFSLRPNWSRYGLLAVWENAEAAGKFFETSSLIQAYHRHADEIWTVWLLPIEAHGTWSGVNPFSPLTTPPTNGPIAVLTRAMIRLSHLRASGSAVSAASRAPDKATGLLASIGIGRVAKTAARISGGAESSPQAARRQHHRCHRAEASRLEIKTQKSGCII